MQENTVQRMEVYTTKFQACFCANLSITLKSKSNSFEDKKKKRSYVRQLEQSRFEVLFFYRDIA